jgi:hypothetical protein
MDGEGWGLLGDPVIPEQQDALLERRKGQDWGKTVV